MRMLDDVLLVPKNHEKVASDQLAPKEWAKSEPEDHTLVFLINGGF